MSTNSIVIEVPSEEGPVTLRYPPGASGGARTIWVSPEDVGRVLMGLGTQPGHRMGPWTDWLGWAGLAWRGSWDKECQLILRRPAGQRLVHAYHDEGELEDATVTIPVPMVWDLSWTDRRLSHSAIWLVKDDGVRSLTQPGIVRPWPYGNVYDDGHVCWGENRVDDVGPHDPLEVEARFFGSPFNTDLRNIQ